MSYLSVAGGPLGRVTVERVTDPGGTGWVVGVIMTRDDGATTALYLTETEAHEVADQINRLLGETT